MSDLAERIAAADAPRVGVRLWPLVQAGFVLQGDGRTLVVDPWLSDHLERTEGVRRARPAPFPPHALRDVDVVLVTHEHPDHLDPGTVPALAGANPTATWVVPAPLVDALADLGAGRGRIEAARVGVPLTAGGVPVRVVAAAHSLHPEAFGGYRFWTDPDGTHRAVGYVVDLGGLRLFHAGDTVWWPGLERELAAVPIDVALLPINGRDAAREAAGLVGNLLPREAADLAAAAGARLVVPYHWDGVVGNTADPAELVREVVTRHPALALRLPAVGEPILLTP